MKYMVRWWCVCLCDVTTLNQQTCSKFRPNWTRSNVLADMANLFDEIWCYCCCCCCVWGLHVNYHQHNYTMAPHIHRSHSGFMLDEWFGCVCVCRVKRMKLRNRGKKTENVMHGKSVVGVWSNAVHAHKHFGRQKKGSSAVCLSLITPLNISEQFGFQLKFLWMDSLQTWNVRNWSFGILT